MYVDGANDPISREEFDNLKATVNRLEKLAERQIILNRRLESVIEKQNAKIQDLQTTVSQYAELVERQENNISLQAKQIRQLESIIYGSEYQKQQHKDLSKTKSKTSGIEKSIFMTLVVAFII